MAGYAVIRVARFLSGLLNIAPSADLSGND